MTIDVLKRFSANLKKQRIQAGVTQEDLARKAGISVKYLQNLEGAKPKNPSLLTIHKLANGLGIEMKKLI